MLAWSWLEDRAAAGPDSRGKSCACACVPVCSQPVATQPPPCVGPSAGSASPAADPLGHPTWRGGVGTSELREAVVRGRAQGWKPRVSWSVLSRLPRESVAQGSGRGENRRASSCWGQGEPDTVLWLGVLGPVTWPLREAPASGCNNGHKNTGNANLSSGRENTGNVRMQGVEPGRWAGRGSLPSLALLCVPAASRQTIAEKLPGLSSDTRNMGSHAFLPGRWFQLIKHHHHHSRITTTAESEASLRAAGPEPAFQQASWVIQMYIMYPSRELVSVLGSAWLHYVTAG